MSTRAWQESATGTLDDGLAKEYKVKSCILLLFEGSDEASATLKQVAQISETPKSLSDDPNQVTTYITETVELESAPTANLYALAVVNGDGHGHSAAAVVKVLLEASDLAVGLVEVGASLSEQATALVAKLLERAAQLVDARVEGIVLGL